jgi:hypothetical protein
MADALRVEHDDLAVDHRVAAGQRREGLGRLAVAPVQSSPLRVISRTSVIDEGQRPVAVELDLVQPVLPLRRRSARAWRAAAAPARAGTP